MITKVSRVLIPSSGKAALFGYDAAGRFIHGISAPEREDPVKWARRGVSDKDLPKLRRAYAEYQEKKARSV